MVPALCFEEAACSAGSFPGRINVEPWLQLSSAQAVPSQTRRLVATFRSVPHKASGPVFLLELFWLFETLRISTGVLGSSLPISKTRIILLIKFLTTVRALCHISSRWCTAQWLDSCVIYGGPPRPPPVPPQSSQSPDLPLRLAGQCFVYRPRGSSTASRP